MDKSDPLVQGLAQLICPARHRKSNESMLNPAWTKSVNDVNDGCAESCHPDEISFGKAQYELPKEGG